MRRTIAIIGATEKMGVAVAKELVTGPYHLLLTGTGNGCPDHLLGELKEIVPGTDAEIFHCLVDASWEADIIILAIPVCEENEIVSMLKEVATGKIVISVAEVSAGNTTEDLRARLPYSKIVRAWSESLNEVPYIPVIDGRSVRAFIELNK